MSRVLAIGDQHEHVSHKHAIDFCVDTYNKYNCDKVVCIGDVVDHHAVSFHAQNPNCPAAKDEYDLTKIKVAQWHDTFPNAIVCVGNHDARIERLSESVNIPTNYLKSYNEVWETPTWRWVFDTIIDKVYYFHGVGSSGKTPALNKANSMGMSVVMGHIHSVGGCHYAAGPKKRWFGLDCGCLIDREAWQFAYGKHMPKKPILGCGVVLDGDGFFIPMPTEKYK